MPKIIELVTKKRKLENLEYDNQPSTSQSKPKSKTILLSQNKNKRYIVNWLGVNEKENTKEEPLVLNFDNQDYYFYSTNIKTLSLRGNIKWINYQTKLDKNQKEKVLKAYEKKINQNDLLQQNTLLTLKLNRFFSFFKNLSKKNIILNYKIFKYKNQTDKLNQEIKSFQKENITNENLENALKKITDYNNRLDSLNDNQPLSFKEKTKTITLNNNNFYSINWFGVSEKENTKEEPLVLNFDNQDYYFYWANIDIVKKKRQKDWINYQFKLDKNQQKKIFEAYEKKIDQNNLFQLNLLLKLKSIYYMPLKETKELDKNIKNNDQPSTSDLTIAPESVNKIDINQEPPTLTLAIAPESINEIDINQEPPTLTLAIAPESINKIDINQEPPTLTLATESESVMDIIKKPKSSDSIPEIDFDWIIDMTKESKRKEEPNIILNTLNTFINSSENFDLDESEFNLEKS